MHEIEISLFPIIAKKFTRMLKKKIKTVGFVFLLLLLLISISSAYSSFSSAKPAYITNTNENTAHSFRSTLNMPNQWHPFVTNNNSLLIATDFLTIKLVGTDNRILPIIFFWYTPDSQGSRIKFSVAYKALIEYNDTNGDNVYQHNEMVENRKLPLSLGNWSYQIVGPYNDSVTGKTIDIHLWTTGWIVSGQQNQSRPFLLSDIPQPDRDNFSWCNSVKVSFTLHIYQKNVTKNIPGSDITYRVLGGLDTKMDFNITGWPFLSLKHRLAVEFSLNGNAKETEHESNKEKHIFELHMSNGTVKVDPAAVGNETINGYEHKFLDTVNTTEDQIDFVSAFQNIPHGTFKWIKKAIITNSTTNKTSLVNVTASYISNGRNLLLYLSYPSFNGTLSHDPTIGVVKTSNIPGNNPPNIISVDYPHQISTGENLIIKINATDDFSVERVEVIFTSPTHYVIKKDASLGQNGLFYCIVSTTNWEAGTWYFQVKVSDIFDASTVSKNFEINVLKYGTTSESPFTLESLVVVIAGIPIDLLWSIFGLSIGGFALLAFLYIRSKKRA